MITCDVEFVTAIQGFYRREYNEDQRPALMAWFRHRCRVEDFDQFFLLVTESCEYLPKLYELNAAQDKLPAKASRPSEPLPDKKTTLWDDPSWRAEIAKFEKLKNQLNWR